MPRIAVTGGIACGKSLVGSFLAARGVAVCEADEVAHRVLEPGGPCYARITAEFGTDLLQADGALDRARLGARVFADREELARLNAIVHPVVKGAWEDWLRSRPHGPAAVIVPLLYECGAGEGWDAVICVAAARSLQLRRLAERGLPAREAVARIEAQMPVREKAARADYVILNNGTKEVMVQQTDRVLQSIMEK